MMAITTNSSMSVKPRFRDRVVFIMASSEKLKRNEETDPVDGESGWYTQFKN